MLSAPRPPVNFATQDRQWDARFNVQEPVDLERLVTAIRAEWDAGKLRYILIGGVEIGTRPYQDDYQVKTRPRRRHLCQSSFQVSDP